MFPSHVTLSKSVRETAANEAQPVSTLHKVALVHQLQAAGLREIEVTSFVSPKWLPQMADNAQVMAALQRTAACVMRCSRPICRIRSGRCRRSRRHRVFAAASEAFSQRNINCSIEESMLRFQPVVEAAHAPCMRVVGDLLCSGCPYRAR